MQPSTFLFTLASLVLVLGACGPEEASRTSVAEAEEPPGSEQPTGEAAATEDDPADAETPAVGDGASGELTAGERAYLAWVVENAEYLGGDIGQERADAAEAALAAAGAGAGTAGVDGQDLDIDRVSCWQVPWSGDRWSVLVSAVDGSWIEMVDSTPEGANAEPYVSANWDGAGWTHAWSSRGGDQPFTVSHEGVAGEMTVHAVGETSNPAWEQYDEVQVVVTLTCG